MRYLRDKTERIAGEAGRDREIAGPQVLDFSVAIMGLERAVDSFGSVFDAVSSPLHRPTMRWVVAQYRTHRAKA